MNHIFERLLPWMPTVVQTALLLYIFIRRRKKIWPYIVIIMLFQLSLVVTSEWLRYWHGRNSELAKYFYPPYSHNFLASALQSFSTIYSGWITAALIGVLLYLVFARHGRRRFLSRHDIWLIVLGTVCVGWPGVYLFVGTIFLLALLWALALMMVRKTAPSDRLLITPFIVPAAVLILWFGPDLLTLTQLDKIRF